MNQYNLETQMVIAQYGGMDLFSAIDENKIKGIKSVSTQIVEKIAIIHNAGIYCKDVETENIVVENQGGEKPTPNNNTALWNNFINQVEILSSLATTKDNKNISNGNGKATNSWLQYLMEPDQCNINITQVQHKEKTKSYQTYCKEVSILLDEINVKNPLLQSNRNILTPLQGISCLNNLGGLYQSKNFAQYESNIKKLHKIASQKITK